MVRPQLFLRKKLSRKIKTKAIREKISEFLGYLMSLVALIPLFGMLVFLCPLLFQFLAIAIFENINLSNGIGFPILVAGIASFLVLFLCIK